MDAVGPHNPYCGAWVSGTWTPNGNCSAETTTTTSTSTTTTHAASPMSHGNAAMTRTRGVASAARVPQRVLGTIIGVNGHLVTIQQAKQKLVIDDQPALDQQATGRVAVGRAITAHGYWQDGTFFANRLSTSS